MQCIVAFSPPLQPSSLWPGEVSSSRAKGSGRSRRRRWGFVSGRMARQNEKEEGGIINISRSSSSSSGLGFSGSAMLGSKELRRTWTENCSVSPAAERKEGPGVRASLMVDPAVWIIRTAVFYVFLETGIAARGRPSSSLDSGDEKSDGKGPLAWIQNLLDGDTEQKKNKELSKVRSKWHASTKGTLVRRYRVPSKAGGRKLLNAISSLLADDDTFRDVATSKGCQIRRENAHAESVCCHNVRALFDELPTPHLIVEITVFPAGPITTAHYEKADKLEKVLRTGASI